MWTTVYNVTLLISCLFLHDLEKRKRKIRYSLFLSVLFEKKKMRSVLIDQTLKRREKLEGKREKEHPALKSRQEQTEHCYCL